jgi:hypothetical protein
VTRDWVRAKEDIGPLGEEGESGFLDTPNNQVRDPRVQDAAALIDAGFDPASVLAALGLLRITHLGTADNVHLPPHP